MSASAGSGRRPGRRLEPADFKRAFERFQKDGITDWAAAMTYYSLLSLFPAPLFGVALLGFFGRRRSSTPPRSTWPTPARRTRRSRRSRRRWTPRSAAAARR
jgi:hypothetical protein